MNTDTCPSLPEFPKPTLEFLTPEPPLTLHFVEPLEIPIMPQWESNLMVSLDVPSPIPDLCDEIAYGENILDIIDCPSPYSVSEVDFEISIPEEHLTLEAFDHEEVHMSSHTRDIELDRYPIEFLSSPTSITPFMESSPTLL